MNKKLPIGTYVLFHENKRGTPYIGKIVSYGAKYMYHVKCDAYMSKTIYVATIPLDEDEIISAFSDIQPNPK